MSCDRRHCDEARTGSSRFKEAVLWTAGGSLSVHLDNINALIMALSLKYIFVFLECNNGNSLVNVIKKTLLRIFRPEFYIK